MKYLIVGLGNIGPDYVHTRHNIGFDVLDALAKSKDTVFNTSNYGDIAEIYIGEKTLLLLKPSTYMNLSGKAVKYWMDKENIPVENVIVITDDLNLPLGKVRVRMKGSAGGHNGLKSINELLGTDQYVRIRFGIGNDFPKGMQVQFVLGRWSPEEELVIQKAIQDTINLLIPLINN